VLDDFNAHKSVDEAHERSEHRGPRFVPIAAAILAMVAAAANLANSQRTTQALLAKNDAILLEAKATDQWNYYQAKSIKGYVYDAQATALGSRGAAASLHARAAKYEREKAAIAAQAKDLEERSAAANERSERRMQSHEVIEIGVTLLEIAIVLVSISALVTTPLLSGAAAAAAGLGCIIALMGILR